MDDKESLNKIWIKLCDSNLIFDFLNDNSIEYHLNKLPTELTDLSFDDLNIDQQDDLRNALVTWLNNPTIRSLQTTLGVESS